MAGMQVEMLDRGRGLRLGCRSLTRRKKKQIPRGNDRKKGKGKGNGFDAKGAKGSAKFRDVERATADAGLFADD
jgi:hypothetical protein